MISTSKSNVCAVIYLSVFLACMSAIGFCFIEMLDAITTTPIEQSLRYYTRVKNNIAIIKPATDNDKSGKHVSKQ